MEFEHSKDDTMAQRGGKQVRGIYSNGKAKVTSGSAGFKGFFSAGQAFVARIKLELKILIVGTQININIARRGRYVT